MVWTTQNEGILQNERYLSQDLVVFFKHQLMVKIMSEQKRLISTGYSEKWVTELNLVCDFLF